MSIAKKLMEYKKTTGETWNEIAEGTGLTLDVVQKIASWKTAPGPLRTEILENYTSTQTSMALDEGTRPDDGKTNQKKRSKNDRTLKVAAGLRSDARKCVDVFRNMAGLETDTDSASILINKGFEYFIQNGIKNEALDKYKK